MYRVTWYLLRKDEVFAVTMDLELICIIRFAGFLVDLLQASHTSARKCSRQLPSPYLREKLSMKTSKKSESSQNLSKGFLLETWTLAITYL